MRATSNFSPSRIGPMHAVDAQRRVCQCQHACRCFVTVLALLWMFSSTVMREVRRSRSCWLAGLACMQTVQGWGPEDSGTEGEHYEAWHSIWHVVGHFSN